MRTIISNRITVIMPTKELRMWCEENLIVTNPKWQTLTRLGKQDQINRYHISKDMKLYVDYNDNTKLILPFGVLNAIWTYIKDYPYELKFNDNGDVIEKDLKSTMPLFDYQEEAVERMIAAKGGVLEAAAGSGKTNCGIEIAIRLRKNTLWLCHTGDLLRQTVERIHKLYPSVPVGTITEGKLNFVSNGITVSTIQTLSAVDPEYYKNVFDVIITDECHKTSSSPTLQKMFGRVIEAIPARYKYGLSATPQRGDTLTKSIYTTLGCNLSGDFLPVFTIAKEKTNTLRAKHIKYDLDTPWDYSVLSEDGTFDYMALLDFLGHNKKRNEEIINNVINVLPKHQKQIVLCQRVEQCEEIYNELLKRGIKSVLLVGKVKKKVREAILHGEVDYNVIVGSYSLVKEGIDIPELSCLHWAMLTGNKVDTIQSAGRIERVCIEKPDPEIYDYVDINYPYCVGKYKKRVSYLKRR